MKLDMVAHTCNPRTQKVEAAGEGILREHFMPARDRQDQQEVRERASGRRLRMGSSYARAGTVDDIHTVIGNGGEFWPGSVRIAVHREEAGQREQIRKPLRMSGQKKSDPG